MNRRVPLKGFTERCRLVKGIMKVGGNMAWELSEG